MRDLDDPTNRDSVHAMLTPGEFVLNKEASTMFAPMIKKMNNAGLQQRAQGNQAVRLNKGGSLPTLPTAAFNTGGLVDFLKKHEGYRDHAYQDQAGVWTIGYGRTRNSDGSPIRPGQTTSQDEEDAWLNKRAGKDRSATKAFAEKHNYDFNDNELDALASFRYNIGNLDQLTAGGTRDKATIMEKLPLYNKAGGQVSQGLNNRRAAELALFQGGGEQEQTAPVPQQETAPPVYQSEGMQLFAESEAAPSYQAEPQPVQYQHDPQQVAAAIDTSDMPSYYRDGPPQSAPNISGMPSYYRDGPPTEENQFMFANRGGPVYLNTGGWFNSMFDEDEEVQAFQPAFPGQVPPQVEQARQAQAAQPPQPVAPPPMDSAPPAPTPGSDEDLLQNSSQADMNQPGPPPEIQEIYGDIWNQLDEPGKQEILKSHGYNDRNEQLGGAVQSGIIGPDSVPSQNYIQAQMDAGHLTTPQLVESGLPPQQIQDFAQASVSGQIPPRVSQPGEVPGPYDPAAQVPQLQAIADGSIDPAAIQEAAASGAPVDPNAFDPRGAEQQAAPAVEAALAETPEARSEATQQIRSIVDQQAPPESEDSAQILSITKQAGGPEAIEAKGKEAIDAEPGKMGGFVDALKGAFGDLFDKKELARAAILMAGGIATGMSPRQALAFAGKGYIGRIDAKEAAAKQQAAAKAANHDRQIHDLVKGGKYDPKSINAYKKSGDPTDLVLKGDPAEAPVRTGNFKTLYGPNGAVKVEEVKFGDQVKQVDAQGNFVSEFDHSADASSQAYTPEGRERMQTESKEYAGIIAEAQGVIIEANKAAGTGTVNTGILPKAAGNEAARWAIENNVPPAGMGRLLTNAFEAAQFDGKKAKSIVPYLNDQFIKANVGDTANFKHADGKAVEAQKTNQWLSTMSNNLRRANPEVFGNASNTEISQFLLGSSANSDWVALPEEVKATYAKQGRAMGYSGWMFYMNQQL